MKSANSKIDNSIVVLTFNNLERCTIPCLKSLLKYTDLSVNEIIIVDNASSDGTQRWITDFASKFNNVKVILNKKNLGYAKGNNVGIRAASGQKIVLLNNDTLVTQNWLSSLSDPFKNRDVGVVGAITNRLGSMQQVNIPGLDIQNYNYVAARFTRNHRQESFSVSKLCFFCVSIKREILLKVGLLDENFIRGNYEDDDYCARVISEGYKLKIAEDCFVYHMGSVSFSQLNSAEMSNIDALNRAYFEKKHGITYSVKNLLKDYDEIAKNARNVESIIFRQQIKSVIDSLNSRIEIPSSIKQRIKYFDSRYMFGLLAKILSHINVVSSIQIKKEFQNILNFYKTYGIEGVFWRLRESMGIVKDPLVSLPEKMPQNLPIFILSYNRLVCLRQLVNYLCSLGLEKNITIIDNNSSYPPLLRYLGQVHVKVVRLNKNYGHLALWKSKCFEHVINSVPFVYTDCDILPDLMCPEDFLVHMYKHLRKSENLGKVGFSLLIDDLPNDYQRKKEVILWEYRWWQVKDPINSNFFQSPIDTTFALYRPKLKPFMRHWWTAARSNFPYVAKHYPWYATKNNSKDELEESKYYEQRVKRGTSHWFTKDYLA